MSPPENTKAARTGAALESSQQATKDISTVAHTTDRRSTSRQTTLPIVAALAYPPSPGLKTALIVVEDCPRCGWPHTHRSPWPLAKLLAKSGRCGTKYQLIPYARRKRRRAA